MAQARRPCSWKLELGTAHVKPTNSEHTVPKPRVTGWTWLGKQWPSAKGPRSIRKTRRSLEEFTGGLIPWTRCVPIFGPALKRGEAKQSMKGKLMMVTVMMTMIMLMMTTASVTAGVATCYPYGSSYSEVRPHPLASI